MDELLKARKAKLCIKGQLTHFQFENHRHLAIAGVNDPLTLT